jgi:UrcA family protein
MKNLITLIAAAGITLSLSTLAQADGARFAPLEKVQFSNLDLNQNPAVVYRRIKLAAANVCSRFDSDRSLSVKQVHANCMQLAIDDAVAQVDQPAFTAFAQTQEVGQSPVRFASRR